MCESTDRSGYGTKEGNGTGKMGGMVLLGSRRALPAILFNDRIVCRTFVKV